MCKKEKEKLRKNNAKIREKTQRKKRKSTRKHQEKYNMLIPRKMTLVWK